MEFYVARLVRLHVYIFKSIWNKYPCVNFHLKSHRYWSNNIYLTPKWYSQRSGSSYTGGFSVMRWKWRNFRSNLWISGLLWSKIDPSTYTSCQPIIHCSYSWSHHIYRILTLHTVLQRFVHYIFNQRMGNITNQATSMINAMKGEDAHNPHWNQGHWAFGTGCKREWIKRVGYVGYCKGKHVAIKSTSNGKNYQWMIWIKTVFSKHDLIF